tara:strand:+ start:296 stop:463 length:168 start_codon:yes stop_codon:yes gene_type:complete
MKENKKFNGILIKKSTPKDVKIIEKLIDEEEKRKDEEMNEKIHSWNPNKGYWRNY